MKILVVGSGGREHALVWSFAKSEKVSKIYCANGNAGISRLAECLNIKPHEIELLADFAETNSIDLTFVGGETALALGIVDEFEKRGLAVIGASEKASQLEASKAFAKDFMARHQIPTARYQTLENVTEAKKTLENGFFGDENSPVVVKADGLAAGKGVVVAQNRREAFVALEELESLAGKDATRRIVLEEKLNGKEVSLILFADGKDFILMPPARDHKRIGENDTGANTGGMGTFTDDNLLSAEQITETVRKIIIPTLEGCRQEGFVFRGVLFLGLMLTPDGIKVLEYNVRFGDPETQSILVRLETDLVEVCQAILQEKLKSLEVRWKKGSSACVILASAGYPAKPQIGEVIEGLDFESKNPCFFHSGTAQDEKGSFITAGGRVLGVTATAENLEAALNLIYQTIEKISWKGMTFRRDIGR